MDITALLVMLLNLIHASNDLGAAPVIPELFIDFPKIPVVIKEPPPSELKVGFAFTLYEEFV
jgi:hypothetical protein